MTYRNRLPIDVDGFSPAKIRSSDDSVENIEESGATDWKISRSAPGAELFQDAGGELTDRETYRSPDDVNARRRDRSWLRPRKVT